jgi:uncharacterized protein YycO
MTLLRFTRGTGLGGAIVRLATFCSFAHVGFKLDDGKVLDATPTFGVSIRDAVDDETTEYWSIAAPKATIAAAVEWGKAQVGKPYDWTSIIGLGLRRDWHCDSAWFCSELVTAAFDHVHWPIIRDSGRFDRITPRDLMMATRIQRLKPQPSRDQ